MTDLAIVRTEFVRQYACDRGLESVDCGHGGAVEFEVPPVSGVSDGQPFLVPSERLSNLPSTVVRLRRAIVRGRNLSVIHHDSLLPTGNAHSFNWVQMGGFTLSSDGRCTWPPTPCTDLEDDAEFVVLGICSHFGHFFTDCLDRLLAVEHVVTTRARRYLVDGQPPAQVCELLAILGLSPSGLCVLDSALDYRVRNLRIATLNSAKPAISLSSFQSLRERVLRGLPHLHHEGYLLYVGRKAVGKRRILNQDDFLRALVESKFRAFYPEEHSFQEAAAAFYGADVVVIVLGSSKFNLALCRPGTRVICLAPAGYAEKSGPVSVMLRQLCALFLLELCFCSCRIVGADVGLDSDMVVEVRDVTRAMGMLGA